MTVVEGFVFEGDQFKLQLVVPSHDTVKRQHRYGDMFKFDYDMVPVILTTGTNYQISVPMKYIARSPMATTDYLEKMKNKYVIPTSICYQMGC